MASHKPPKTLLSLIEQILLEHPEGTAPRVIFERLVQQGENISRPTLNRLLALGVDNDLWKPLGEGRNVVYLLGSNSLKNSLTLLDTNMVKSTPKTTNAAERTNNGSVHSQIRAIVWGIADALRDKTQLQVEAYQPVTLALMALKHNFDIQQEELSEGGQFFDRLKSETLFIASGARSPKDVATTLNQELKFWDPSALQDGRFGLPFMTWDDLVNFKDSDKSGVRDEPYVIVLRSNPENNKTPETALWTYTTYAPDLKALLLEIIDSLVPVLKESFGAIGVHNVLNSQSDHSATLSNDILRQICSDCGDGKANKKGLANFDFGLKNISQDVFSDTYMDLLGRFAEDSGKKGGEYFTPTRLVEIAIKFCNIEKFAKTLSDNPNAIFRVGDPTAGSNTFLIKVYELIVNEAKNNNWRIPSVNQFAFFAQELKSTQVGLGVFNMFYRGLASQLNPTDIELQTGRPMGQGGIVARTNGNVITEYTTKIGMQSNQLDLVLANPPYGTEDYGIVYANGARNSTQDKRWLAGVPTRSEGEWSFMQTIVDLLAPTGEATIVLPLGVLFRDGGSSFRQWLVEKDWIEAIIATPSNQFLTTSIPVCLILLNKNKTNNKGGVFFVNASNDFTKEGKFNHWNEEKALQSWKAREEIPHYSGFVSSEKLKKNKYSLAVNRYFSKPTDKIEYDPDVLNNEMQTLQNKALMHSQWLFGKDGMGGVIGQAQRAWKEAQVSHQHETDKIENCDIDHKQGEQS